MKLTEENRSFLFRTLIENNKDASSLITRLKQGKNHYIVLAFLTANEYAGQKAIGMSTYVLKKFRHKIQANKYRDSLGIHANGFLELDLTKLPDDIVADIQASLNGDIFKLAIHQELESQFNK